MAQPNTFSAAIFTHKQTGKKFTDVLLPHDAPLFKTYNIAVVSTHNTFEDAVKALKGLKP